MKAVGLMPSDTGKPGGKQTGERMADYAIEGGVFDQAFEKLVNSDFRITWYDYFPSRHVTAQALQAALEGAVEGVDPENVTAPTEGPASTSKPTRVKYLRALQNKPMGQAKFEIDLRECSGHFAEEQTEKADKASAQKNDHLACSLNLRKGIRSRRAPGDSGLHHTTKLKRWSSLPQSIAP